eukprot:12046772-Alexandrium_andersonii.AAC.1
MQQAGNCAQHVMPCGGNLAVDLGRPRARRRTAAGRTVDCVASKLVIAMCCCSIAIQIYNVARPLGPARSRGPVRGNTCKAISFEAQFVIWWIVVRCVCL